MSTETVRTFGSPQDTLWRTVFLHFLYSGKHDACTAAREADYALKHYEELFRASLLVQEPPLAVSSPVANLNPPVLHEKLV